MATYSLYSFVNPVEGQDEAYNEWYDAVHVPDVLALPGFKRAQRFRLDPFVDEPMRYLTVYEVEADDPQEVLDRVRAGESSFRPSDTVDRSTGLLVVGAPISPVFQSES